MRELIYYVAVSMDGYIAGPDGQFDAFLMEGDHMQGINEHYADTVPTAFAASLGLDQSGGRFGTVLMGSATWGVGLPDHPSPYRHLEQYVFTRRQQQPAEGVTFTDRDPVALVRELKEQPGKDIWLCGGGRLAGQLIGEIDRFLLKRQPVLFGSGIPLIAGGAYDPRVFTHVGTHEFTSGVSFADYERIATD